MKSYSKVQQKGVRSDAPGHSRRWASALATVCFATSIFALYTGVFVAVGVEPPAGGMICMRAERLNAGVIVLVRVGSPPRLEKAFLRLDRVHNASTPRLILGDTSFQASATVRAVTPGLATTPHVFEDLFLVSTGAEHSLRRAVARFQYSPGAEASIHPLVGDTIEVSQTHVCFGATTQGDEGLRKGLVSFTVDTDGSIWSRDGVPACDASARSELFPHAAALNSWLRLYGSANVDLEERRSADVERGVGGNCTAEALTTYPSDCEALGGCRVTPTTTFARAVGSSSNVRVVFMRNRTGYFETSTAELGYRLAGRTGDEQVVTSLTRLLLILLAAAVTHIRKDVRSSSVVHTLTDAISSLSRDCKAKETEQFTCREATVGMVALASRVWIIVMVAPLLTADGTTPVLLVEGAAIATSGAHFAMRHAPTDVWRRQRSYPPERLGGSMAIIDVAMSILLSFHQHVHTSAQSFARIGRLLAALLLSLTCCNLCCFGATACGVRIVSMQRCGSSAGIPLSTKLTQCITAAGAVAWFVQIFAIGHQVTYIFATPFAFSLNRASTASYTSSTANVALSLLMLGYPLQNLITQSVLRSYESP